MENSKSDTKELKASKDSKRGSKKDSKKKDKKSKKENRRSSKGVAEGQAQEGTKRESREERSKGKKRSRSEDKPSKKSHKKAKRESTGSHKSDSALAKDTNQDKFLSNDETVLDKFRSSHRITVYGDVTNFAPMNDFKNTGFSADLLKITQKFKQPTPIQAQTWPMLLAGRDVIGIAETGSGKTLAFGLPGLTNVKVFFCVNYADTFKECRAKGSNKPQMLILAPTRELAQQSADVLTVVGEGCNPKISCITIYGGVPKGPQKAALSRSSMY